MGDSTAGAPTRPKEIVARGWDAASTRYRPDRSRSDAFGHDDEECRRWIAPLRDQLPAGAEILDLGCGNGWPFGALLSDRYRVTGVDLSPVQVERGRATVPRMTFQLADMTAVDFEEDRFAAVLAFYSIIHVPLVEQPHLFDSIARWLAPRGWFIATLGAGFYTGTEPDWLSSGAPMYWSHADGATYRRWLEMRGFEVLDETVVPEPGGSGHVLFRSRGPE